MIWCLSWFTESNFKSKHTQEIPALWKTVAQQKHVGSHYNPEMIEMFPQLTFLIIEGNSIKKTLYLS